MAHAHMRPLPLMPDAVAIAFAVLRVAVRSTLEEFSHAPSPPFPFSLLCAGPEIGMLTNFGKFKIEGSVEGPTQALSFFPLLLNLLIFVVCAVLLCLFDTLIL
jgi:hypothetical protein